jgi:hypothetical protein
MSGEVNHVTRLNAGFTRPPAGRRLVARVVSRATVGDVRSQRYGSQ